MLLQNSLYQFRDTRELDLTTQKKSNGLLVRSHKDTGIGSSTPGRVQSQAKAGEAGFIKRFKIELAHI